MRVIIAGSREIRDYETVVLAIALSGFEITAIVSGAARGVDRLGERFATEHNLPVARFPAQWDRYVNSAGHIRNGEMARSADALIAVWDGFSVGTRDMIDQARRAGLKVHVFQP